jgi:chorismate-pyruvate lyase
MADQGPIGSVSSTVSDCELNGLSDVECLLLTTDGSLTRLLEVLCRETLVVSKLREQGLRAPQPIDLLEVGRAEWLVERTVLLCGEGTGTVYVYARSLIALHRMEARFRQELLSSNIPVGRLFHQNRMEILKEIVDCRHAPAGEIAPFFHVDAAARLLSRTCRVQSQGAPIMLITEYLSPHLPRMIDRRRANRDIRDVLSSELRQAG